MIWEGGGMVWEGGGMMLKIIRSIAINFCKRSTKPKKAIRSSDIHMIKSFIRPTVIYNFRYNKTKITKR